MGCHKIKTPFGNGFLCLKNIYEYKGYFFEYHNYLGPTPVHKKTLELRKTIPPGFWKMFDEFKNFTEKEKRKYLIYG